MIKFCIDAGHGGKDSGAVNGGCYEKAVTLAVARKLRERLLAKKFDVIMTRSTDDFLELQTRCNVANNANADYFISIHCNSATNKSASGIETFTYTNVSQKTKTLANEVQKHLMLAIPEEKNRGVKQANYHVLRRTKMPAILIELGFISHDETKKKLFTTRYQDRLVDGIVNGIMSAIA